MEELVGIDLLKGNNKKLYETKKLLTQAKVVGLYFGAHWAPPCRAFNERLKTFYIESNIRNSHGCFEVVFISDDKTKASFDSHIKQMPWAVLPFEEKKIKEEIKQLLGINGVPCLVVMSYPDCIVITTGGAKDILNKQQDDAWQDWDILSAKVRALKRDKDEEFQVMALVR